METTLTIGRFGNVELAAKLKAGTCLTSPRTGQTSKSLDAIIGGPREEGLKLPPLQVIVSTIVMLSTQMIVQEVLKRRQEEEQQKLAEQQQQGKDSATPPTAAPSPAPAKSEPSDDAPPAPKRFNGVGPELWVVSQGVRDEMDRVAGYYRDVAERFDKLSGAFNAARKAIKDGRLDANLAAVVELYDGYVEQLRQLTPRVLEMVMRIQGTMFQWVEDQSIVEQSVQQAFDAFFAKDVGLVDLYAQAFRQTTDDLPAYRSVKALRAYHHGLWRQFKRALPKGVDLPVGDKNLYFVSDLGPATIPGTKHVVPDANDPACVNLILMLFDELFIRAFNWAIYGHEWYHDVGFGIIKLLSEQGAAVKEDMEAAAKAGQFHFQDEFVELPNGEKVPTLPFLIMVILQTLTEILADVLGGFCSSGGAKWKTILMEFMAFFSRGNVLETDQDLRSGSTFDEEKQQDGSVQYKVEVHPQDLDRPEFQAESLLQSGFPQADADECRAYTAQSVNFAEPEYIVFRSREGDTFKVRRSDYRQVIPVVVKTILFRKMNAMGGLSHAEIFGWTPQKEARTQRMVQVLRSFYFGQTELKVPEDQSELEVNEFGAAMTHVYWLLVKEGQKPKYIIKKLSVPGLAMMIELEEQAEAKAKAEAALAVSAPATV